MLPHWRLYFNRSKDVAYWLVLTGEKFDGSWRKTSELHLGPPECSWATLREARCALQIVPFAVLLSFYDNFRSSLAFHLICLPRAAHERFSSMDPLGYGSFGPLPQFDTSYSSSTSVNDTAGCHWPYNEELLVSDFGDVGLQLAALQEQPTANYSGPCGLTDFKWTHTNDSWAHTGHDCLRCHPIHYKRRYCHVGTPSTSFQCRECRKVFSRKGRLKYKPPRICRAWLTNP